MTRTLVLERFAAASRRYRSAEPAAVCDLFGARKLLGSLRKAAAWLGADVSWPTKGRLLAAALRTRGSRTTRLGALVFAPDLFRRVRAGEFDRVACFSTKDFALAQLLAEETGHPCDELLGRGTQYFGELAFELLAVIPYAYWLHSAGRLEFTASTRDTRCLYYFSPRHEEATELRGYVPITEYPVGERGLRRYDRHEFPVHLDETKWRPPPYKEIYRNDVFRWGRETCVVGNKTSIEAYMQDGRPVNSLDTDLLLEVIGRLRHRYQVIYNRPRRSDIASDGTPPRESGDIEAVRRRFPDVICIQDVAADHPDLTFNELQLRIYANCGRFVSMLGGGSYLASYFGGTNVVYARRGWEVRCRAYENWFHRFSGARVVRAGSPAELLAAVEAELVRTVDR